MAESGSHYVVTWRDAGDGTVKSVRARTIRDSVLGLTFVAVSDFLFGSGSAIVNPAEEALARRFEKTRALHLSIHAIQSVEEVGDDHAGLTLDGDRTNVVVLQPDKRT